MAFGFCAEDEAPLRPSDVAARLIPRCCPWWWIWLTAGMLADWLRDCTGCGCGEAAALDPLAVFTTLAPFSRPDFLDGPFAMQWKRRVG
jgi:hypothetical protein